ncbi:hypothetical protein JW921_05450 [Candidatus Fermentibacterales bacterium]|nr:hypothetical protein [Candidatus Fermentibacterales bacterium]
MEENEIILLAAVTLAIVAGIIALAVLSQKRRTKRWREVAERNGFEFAPVDDQAISGLPFDLFKRGHSRRNRNSMKWYSGPLRMQLSEYQYTISTGRSSTTVRQAVLLVLDESLGIAPFSLRREMGVLDWLGEKLGAQDIDFPEDEEFSKSFVLKGEEHATRSRFGADLRAYLIQNRRSFSTLEGAGSALLLARGRTLKAESYHEFVELGSMVHSMLDKWGHAPFTSE